MNPYDDIIRLPHPTSKKHARMSMRMRAAQFASFAALQGHEAAIAETGRLTDSKREADGYEREKLDFKLMELCEMLESEACVRIRVTHFIPDAKKQGGRYQTECAAVRKVDFAAQKFILTENRTIEVCNIFDFSVVKEESDRDE